MKEKVNILTYFFGALTPELVDASNSDSSWAFSNIDFMHMC